MNIRKILLLSAALFCLFSCKKYLDKVPDKSLTVPSKLKDLEALLNNDILYKRKITYGEISSDNYYLDDNTFQRMPKLVRNCYTWQPDIYQANTSYDWNYAYKSIYYSNIVLDELKHIQSSSDPELFDLIKGRSLFYRAFSFFDLAKVFASVYVEGTAKKDLGIPLKTDASLEHVVKRSSLKKTFNQIINDLNKAKDLLPAEVFSNDPNIPSKSAAYALMARVYLYMQDYGKALHNADSSLYLYNQLIDYNTIDTTRLISFPFPTNKEVLFLAYEGLYFYFTGPSTAVDTTLYQSYSLNDLRRPVFFATRQSTGTHYFKASYTGTYDLFCGLATDEVYFIKAECEARIGNVDVAMETLNKVLVKRWRKGTFHALRASGKENALRIILRERRKELVFRNLRWMDLKRLNTDPKFAITLKRVVKGKKYVLPPGDMKYTFPLPLDEIELNHLKQNKRK